jgi:hypothetical protein
MRWSWSHSVKCESAKSDSPRSFLGIAPRIVQRGTPAVVAMRYPVLVSTDCQIAVVGDH